MGMMQNQKFEILSINESQYLLIACSSQPFDYYQSEVIQRFKDLRVQNAVVFFDFLCSNGFSNRFFMLNIGNQIDHKLRFVAVKNSSKIACISQSFFAEHPIYIERSILTNKQKEEYFSALC